MYKVNLILPNYNSIHLFRYFYTYNLTLLLYLLINAHYSNISYIYIQILILLHYNHNYLPTLEESFEFLIKIQYGDQGR
jgi:hypothetical protein